MYSSHIYISFSYRDACPNAIIEAMSFGLPVIGISSGGVPDIVGNAGSLIPNKDFENGFFSPHRFSCNFPSINYNLVLEELKKLCALQNESFTVIGSLQGPKEIYLEVM